MGEEKKKMSDSDKFGITGIAFGIVIPLIGMILSIIGLAKAEDDRTIPAIGIGVSLFSWFVWVIV